MKSNTLSPGTLLRGKSNTYIIQEVLGQGTFGITYLAITTAKVTGALGELETSIRVAIKEFFMRDINGREENTVTTGSQGSVYINYKKKFAHEVENLSRLDHPHIVKVLEYFEANNTVYYAMEYVEGGSLDKYIMQQNGLTEGECVKYTLQIGSALTYMHAHKMLHLDLKPGNIMLRINKDVVLIDFGLSKQYDKNGEPESSTCIGSGTPGYAPIEQTNYQKGKDFPTTMDVYALGATMYKMLTGVRPPEASVILNDGFPTYELRKHLVDNTLIACVARAMSSLQKDRPKTVEEFLKELQGSDVKNDDEEETEYTTILDKKIVTKEEQKRATQSGEKNRYILIEGIIGCLCIVSLCIVVFVAIYNIIFKVQQDDTNIVQFPYTTETIQFVKDSIKSAEKTYNEVWKEKYDEIWQYREGMAPVKRNGKYGFINEKKEEIIPCKYDYCEGFVNGAAKVKLNGKYGLINKKGIEFIPPVYDHIKEIKKYVIVCLNNKYGLFNINGEKIIPPKYEDIILVSTYEDVGNIYKHAKRLFNDRPAEAVIAIKENGKWYYTDKQGKKIGEPVQNPDNNS